MSEDQEVVESMKLKWPTPADSTLARLVDPVIVILLNGLNSVYTSPY